MVEEGGSPVVDDTQEEAESVTKISGNLDYSKFFNTMRSDAYRGDNSIEFIVSTKIDTENNIWDAIKYKITDLDDDPKFIVNVLEREEGFDRVIKRLDRFTEDAANQSKEKTDITVEEFPELEDYYPEITSYEDVKNSRLNVGSFYESEGIYGDIYQAQWSSEGYDVFWATKPIIADSSEEALQQLATFNDCGHSGANEITPETSVEDLFIKYGSEGKWIIPTWSMVAKCDDVAEEYKTMQRGSLLDNAGKRRFAGLVETGAKDFYLTMTQELTYIEGAGEKSDSIYLGNAKKGSKFVDKKKVGKVILHPVRLVARGDVEVYANDGEYKDGKKAAKIEEDVVTSELKDKSVRLSFNMATVGATAKEVKAIMERKIAKQKAEMEARKKARENGEKIERKAYLNYRGY